MFFNKNKKCKKLDLTNFSIMNISTGQIGAYIIDKLYKDLEFYHIGYYTEGCRCYLYTISENKRYLQYFKDRSPAMIENDIKNLIPKNHSFKKWDNGFIEVVEYGE